MASGHMNGIIRANSTSNVIEQTNQQLVTAFLDLHRDARNNQKLLEFVRSFYSNTLKTQEFCAALQEQHLKPRNNCKCEEALMIIAHEFFHQLSCVYRQQVLMRETLQSFHNSFDDKLARIDALKKVSAVFFTAATAIAAAAAAANAIPKKPAAEVAAAAAAAASILFGALGKWIHSLLKKRESAVRKHKEITDAMIMGAKISIKDLSSIHVSARRLQFEAESMSETVDDVGKKVAAVKKSFEELREKADDYGRNMRWVREVVLHRIITHDLD